MKSITLCSTGNPGTFMVHYYFIDNSKTMYTSTEKIDQYTYNLHRWRFKEKKSSSPNELKIFQKKEIYNHLHEQFWIYFFKQNALKMTGRVWYDKILEEEMFPHL